MASALGGNPLIGSEGTDSSSQHLTDVHKLHVASERIGEAVHRQRCYLHPHIRPYPWCSRKLLCVRRWSMEQGTEAKRKSELIPREQLGMKVV